MTLAMEGRAYISNLPAGRPDKSLYHVAREPAAGALNAAAVPALRVLLKNVDDVSPLEGKHALEV